MRLNSHTLALLGGEFKAALARTVVTVDSPELAIEPDVLIANLVELRGAAALVELVGLRRLLEEAVDCCRDGREGKLSWPQVQPILGTALGIAVAYIDSIAQAETDTPSVLLPEINALRRLRSATPVYEYHLLTDVDWPSFSVAGTAVAMTEEQRKEIGRLRHFWQLGLLDVIRGNGGKAFAFMARAADRLQDVVVDASEVCYWSVVGRVVRAFGTKKLGLFPERLRLLSAVEQQLRKLATDPTATAKRTYPEGLWRAFVALYALAPVGGEQDRALRERLRIPRLGITDADVVAIRRHLLGQHSDGTDDFLPALSTLANALHLRMDTLHAADALWTPDDIAFLHDAVRQVSALAENHSLPRLGYRFFEHTQQLAALAETGARLSQEQRQAIADSILALEALVADFWGCTPSADQLGHWDSRSLAEILQTGIIKAAQRALLKEMSASLQQIKAGLGALATAEGGDGLSAEIDQAFGVICANAFMLDLRQLESLASRCRKFLRGRSLAGGPLLAGGAAESFADALVSIEYYLQNHRPGELATDAALNLADECLTTLGV